MPASRNEKSRKICNRNCKNHIMCKTILIKFWNYAIKPILLYIIKNAWYWYFYISIERFSTSSQTFSAARSSFRGSLCGAWKGWVWRVLCHSVCRLLKILFIKCNIREILIAFFKTAIFALDVFRLEKSSTIFCLYAGW